jgi:hypothetical protein
MLAAPCVLGKVLVLLDKCHLALLDGAFWLVCFAVFAFLVFS